MKSCKKLLYVFGLLFLAVFFSGCVSRLGSFTVVSTKNIEWNRASEYVRSTNRTKGEDIAHIIIIIPTKGNVKIEDAVDNAIEKVPGAVALVDAVIRSRTFYIPYIYGQAAYIVEGSALVDPKLVPVAELEKQNFYIGVADENGSVEVSKVTEDEYYEYSL